MVKNNIKQKIFLPNNLRLNDMRGSVECKGKVQLSKVCLHNVWTDFDIIEDSDEIRLFIKL